MNLAGARGVALFWQAWLPEDEPHGVVMIVHGVTEHSGRFRRVAERLVAQGYAVYALDNRGHGLSGGRRCYVDRFSDFIDDLETFRRLIRDRHPAGPLFMLGHSLGGAIALSYAIEHQDGLDGLVLSAPAVVAGRATHG